MNVTKVLSGIFRREKVPYNGFQEGEKNDNITNDDGSSGVVVSAETQSGASLGETILNINDITSIVEEQETRPKTINGDENYSDSKQGNNPKASLDSHVTTHSIITNDKNQEVRFVDNIADDNGVPPNDAKRVTDGDRVTPLPEHIVVINTIEEMNTDDDEECLENYNYLNFRKFNASIKDTFYRHFFTFAGLLNPNSTVKYPSIWMFLFLYVQRILVAVFIVFFILMKFGACFDMSWIVLEQKYPFTLASYVVWEVRWILTYIITYFFMLHKCFDKFLRGLELPIEKWRKYKQPMFIYICIVLLILVIIPGFFTILDINIFNVKIRKQADIYENIIVIISFVVFRMLVLPGFCMLSVILYLLGDHILITGKRVCVQRTISEAEGLIIRNIRQFTRKTQTSLNVIVFVHMLLIFMSSLTTLMSTIERLELTYKVNNKTNQATMHVAFKRENELPFNELINTKLELIKAKKLIDTLHNKTDNNNNRELLHDTVKVTDLTNDYSIITNLQERQLDLVEKLMTAEQSQQNVSLVNSGSAPPFYQVVMSITDSYNKIRVMLDSLLTILEIFLLYMSPLFLISRTDAIVHNVLDLVIEIDIEDQVRKGYAVTSYALKERLTDMLKETGGVRICGYRVEFFKTLIFASFGPFFAIALRAVWKHFGFY